MTGHRRRTHDRRYQTVDSRNPTLWFLLYGDDMKKLQTTTNQFHDMHVVVDKARPKTKTVTVEKDALFNLLVDHSHMVGELQLNMEDE